jgi:penicillin G amidase
LVNARLLRLINVSIAVLALVVLALVYWFAYRPLPKVSGKLIAPTRRPATITRDALGIPHIQAQSAGDAYFLEGYAMAQDRLWEMDMLRRFGSGQLAEVGGAPMVEVDALTRRLRMRAIAEAQAQRLPASDRMAFLEFARGVNYFIESSHSRLPFEYSIPGHEFSPRPWVVADSLAIGMVMFRDLTDTAKDEIEKGYLMSVAPEERVRTLYPASLGQSLSPGSNAWAVSGSRTWSGHPMLANDTHLGIRIPSIWYEVHLKSPEMNVEGMTLTGLPGIVIGHNESIAWGVTNLGADYMDVYREQIDFHTGRYVFEGQQVAAQLDRQEIGVYGGRPVTVETWVTRHGPVAYSDSGGAYSVRWTAADGFGYAFLDIDRAQDWPAFHAAVGKYWGPPQNFVYADRQGHIGYQASGAMPIRKGFSGDAPLSGSSGKQEWAGYVPYEELPSMLDPPSGIVATANQNPFPAGFPYEVSGVFADRYRIEQIRARLDAKPKLTVDDMLAIEKDVYSAYHHYLASRIVAAAGRKGSSGEAAEAVSVLKSWNGQMDKDEAAPFIADLLHVEMGRWLVHALAPKVVVQHLPRPQVIEGLLRTQPPAWVPNNDWDAWLLARLEAAIAEGRKRQGSPLTRWKWGEALSWTIAHPVGNEIPLVHGFFNIGPVAMSGAGTTVKQTAHNFGPSMRMVVDWGALEKSAMVLPTGESGSVASRHYKDQWETYYKGSALPWAFNSYQPKDVLEVTPLP